MKVLRVYFSASGVLKQKYKDRVLDVKEGTTETKVEMHFLLMVRRITYDAKTYENKWTQGWTLRKEHQRRTRKCISS
jgi:hypothetical protein